LKIWQMILLMLLTMVLVVGCGDDDDDDNDDSADDDDDNSDNGALHPLPASEAVYLKVNGLPVPTARYVDKTQVLSLDGTWSFKADPDDLGIAESWFAEDADRSDWNDIEVPGSYTAAFEELFEYQGPGWYAVEFDVPDAVDTSAHESMMIRLGAVFLRSKIYLNGELIGEHQGGYTPIHLPTGELLRRTGNLLVVRADNRIDWSTVPTDTYFKPGKHGWWPYGGITRSVSLHVLPEIWMFKIEPGYDEETGELLVTLGVRSSARSERRTIEYKVAGVKGSVDLYVPGKGIFIYLFPVEVEPLEFWSRNNPGNLYEFTATDAIGGDEATVRFGRRTIEVDGLRILLNGAVDFWHGINRHSDYPETGPVETADTIDREIEVLQELHANHVRPGHYPVDEHLLDALAEAGITVAEEIPVYQWQFNQMENEYLIGLAAEQLAEMIERDKNNPAILVWSVGNEYGSFWPSSRTLTAALNAQAKKFDPSRPTQAVIVNAPCVVPIDFTLSEVDIIALNQYYGWYMGDVSEAGQCLDTVHSIYPNKAIYASEFGSGALAGRFLDQGVQPGPEPIDDHSYSEEFQAWFLEQHLTQMLERPYLSGFTPWVLADFRMEWDPNTGKPHPASKRNLKGLLTQDRATEKMSFAVVAEIYAELDK
jgi:beta-glucuronidase